jgi:hypothetical protein
MGTAAARGLAVARSGAGFTMPPNIFARTPRTPLSREMIKMVEMI